MEIPPIEAHVIETTIINFVYTNTEWVPFENPYFKITIKLDKAKRVLM